MMGQRKKDTYCNGTGTISKATDEIEGTKYHCQNNVSIKLVRLENDAELLTWIANNLKTNLKFSNLQVADMLQGTANKNKMEVKKNAKLKMHGKIRLKNKTQPIVIKSKFKHRLNQNVKTRITSRNKSNSVDARSRRQSIKLYRSKTSRNSKAIANDELSFKKVKEDTANVKDQSSSDDPDKMNLNDKRDPSVSTLSFDFFVTDALNSAKKIEDIDAESKVDSLRNEYAANNENSTSVEIKNKSENCMNELDLGTKEHSPKLKRKTSNLENKASLHNPNSSENTTIDAKSLKNTLMQQPDLNLSKLQVLPSLIENTDFDCVGDISDRYSERDQSHSKPLSLDSSFNQQNIERSTVTDSTKETIIRTIYDLMNDVAAIIPSWNLHILSDTNTFCIGQVTRNNCGIPYLSKCIEIDDSFNAKVYIYQQHCKKFDGIYDSEYKVAELIKAVNNSC